MSAIEELDRIAITAKSHRLLKRLLGENPKLEEIMLKARNETEALVGVRNWVRDELRHRHAALEYYASEHSTRAAFEALEWRDFAALRILDYIDHAGREFVDPNLRGELAVSNPFRTLWLAVHHGTGGAKPGFFEDMLCLFQQFTGRSSQVPPGRQDVENWMERYPSGLDPRIVRLREENRDRILGILVDRMDRGEISNRRFRFKAGLSRDQKMEKAREWWKDMRFHLTFAVRSPALLNEMLGESLDPDTMKILYQAQDAGIPFFMNPYYLSLLHVRVPYFAIGGDLALRYYATYSKELVEEFGHIDAWEKEDKIVPGKPNAAGWLLPPFDNVHRRYPDVAILIPDTQGRTCGGLCSVCQRMYDFQRGWLNFNLEKLKPTAAWDKKLPELMEYFEADSQLRDILITGGDALMSSDSSLKEVLDAVYEMAAAKRSRNQERPDGEKLAEMLRVRLGTRLPAYLPQRITSELVAILAEFKKRASEVGIQQFVIQTHFESAMELTPDAREAIHRLISAGWTVTNQLVFTAAASRRGHTAKLRQVLNEVGVLPYYTFVVKGYMENNFNYAPIARIVQEEQEEKIFGKVPQECHDRIREFPVNAESMVEAIAELRKEADLPFLATDRSVLNLPAVGKSLTFRTIGITRYGRRILEFDHDRTRAHSPIIDRIGKVVIIESKSMSEYLRQLDDFGEDISEYENVYGYSLGETEPRLAVYEYPAYDFNVTAELTNLELGSEEEQDAGSMPVSGAEPAVRA
ncbi:MAG: KamA family protein [Gemmatimonadales bacterium]|nr:MAG: KamA family protein [Gemmatimonadales bacterium]